MRSGQEKSRGRGTRQALAFIKTSERLLKTWIKLKGCGREENEMQASQKYRDICPNEISPPLRQRSPFWGFASGVTTH